MRQLLLDPAVNHEFERILKALEEKTAEAKRLNQELNGTTFTYESKQGRMLMAKCKLLAVSLQYVFGWTPCTLFAGQQSDQLKLKVMLVSYAYATDNSADLLHTCSSAHLS